jgi:predicted ATPase
MNLTGIGFENFRVFKDEVFFDLAPITVLTGTNNASKSSLFKALLLLEDNMKKNKLNELDFTGEKHNLGNYENTYNRDIVGEEDKYMVFYIQGHDLGFLGEWNHALLNLQYTQLVYRQSNESGKLVNILFCDKKGATHYVSYTEKEIEEDEGFYTERAPFIEINIREILNNISNFKIWIASGDTENIITTVLEESKKNIERLGNIDKTILNIDFLDNNLMSLPKLDEFLENLNNRFIENISEAAFKPEDCNPAIAYGVEDTYSYFDVFDLYFCKSEHFGHNWLFEKREEDENIVKRKINDLYSTDYDLFKVYLDKLGDIELTKIVSNEFKYFFDTILYGKVIDKLKNFAKFDTHYLEAVRANTQRIYTNQSQGTAFNEILLKFSKKSFSENSKQIEFVNTWIKEFGIADEIKFERIQGVATLIKIRKGDKWNDLVDYGYGVTQMLPILLSIVIDFTMKIDLFGGITENSLLVIEEPETNLHPKLQSKLADMLVDATEKFFIQFIIETHSEYLIRKLQYLVAKKTIKPQDVALYYLYEPDNDKVLNGKKQVKKLEIYPDGSLSDDFGEGFFDEATKWKFELLKLKNQN